MSWVYDNAPSHAIRICEININFKQHLQDNFWKIATIGLLDLEKLQALMLYHPDY